MVSVSWVSVWRLYSPLVLLCPPPLSLVDVIYALSSPSSTSTSSLYTCIYCTVQLSPLSAPRPLGHVLFAQCDYVHCLNSRWHVLNDSFTRLGRNGNQSLRKRKKKNSSPHGGGCKIFIKCSPPSPPVVRTKTTLFTFQEKYFISTVFRVNNRQLDLRAPCWLLLVQPSTREGHYCKTANGRHTQWWTSPGLLIRDQKLY